jgi:hypothetical protein
MNSAAIVVCFRQPQAAPQRFAQKIDHQALLANLIGVLATIYIICVLPFSEKIFSLRIWVPQATATKDFV